MEEKRILGRVLSEIMVGKRVKKEREKDFGEKMKMK
jgi:hypothetical protein